MLQVSLDVVVLAACCAAVSWFISVNPVMSVVIKTHARWRILLSRKLQQLVYGALAQKFKFLTRRRLQIRNQLFVRLLRLCKRR